MANHFLRVIVLTFVFSSPLQAQEPLRVGIIIHPSGPLAAASQQSQNILKAYFDELNSNGGINGRKLELVVASTDPADIQRVAGQGVIGFVGGAIAGHEKPVSDVIRTAQVALIGAATLVPPVDPPLNPYGFYLMPGFKEQAIALVNFAAAKPELKHAAATIVYFEGDLNTVGATAVEQQALHLGWNGVSKSVHRYGNFGATALVEDLKRKRSQTVFFFGAPAELKQLVQASEAANITPTFLTIGAMAGDLADTVTPAFKDKFFLSFPSVPGDLTAVDELRTLRDKYKVPATHAAMQSATLAAAKVFSEALASAGANPTRVKLVAALEQLKDFETGYSPRVTFTKTRRVGAFGAHIITYDPASKNFIPLGWTSAD